MEIAPDVVSFIEVLVLDTSALFTNVIERKLWLDNIFLVKTHRQ